MKGVFFATAVIGTGLVSYAARSLFRQLGNNALTGAPHREKVEEKTLAEVSRTWNGKESKTLSGNIVDFREIAKIWREPESEQTDAPLPRPTFKHGEIEHFFSEMVEKRRGFQTVSPDCSGRAEQPGGQPALPQLSSACKPSSCQKPLEGKRPENDGGVPASSPGNRGGKSDAL